jgi:signal transduction histidine kinase
MNGQTTAAVLFLGSLSRMPDACASLRLRQDETRLCFEVRDSGRGFEVSDMESGGLAKMRDRLGAAGGMLVIESQPGNGTVVRGEVPSQPFGEPKGSVRRGRA